MRFKGFVLSSAVLLACSSFSFAETATATLAGTKPGTALAGTIKLADTPKGLQVDADISGAPTGQHAFHIHEFGACGDDGKAAGGHYNPDGHMHGNMLKDGIAMTHAGDFGNITVGADGKASLHVTVPGLALSSGKYNVAGRAFILHEKADDFSQPAGNAGARIGCAPILITKD